METIHHPSKPEKRLSVHSGIYNYLHRKRKDGTSKWDVIQMYLKDIMESNPDYNLFLAGHSLGGSLAILLAFRLLTQSDTALSPGPISVIAFGPMLVGDLRFKRSFQILEKERKLRCLCVVNEGDFIPLIPERGGVLTPYRRVGVYLRLSPTGDMAFSYASRAQTYFQAWVRDMPNAVIHRFRLMNTLCCVKNFSANHDVRHYTDNIKSCANAMSKLEWDLFESGRDAGGFIYDVW
jgi:pimeloyl-ACP methyl ester carboxylesterase